MQWDIFCQVIDNFGDIGVCWRLTSDLAQRGHSVRLWVDDARALEWMAPGATQGLIARVEVLHWQQAQTATPLSAHAAPADVWVEGFGCELPEAWVAHRFSRVPSHLDRRPTADRSTNHSAGRDSGLEEKDLAPVWINLEYLSAEPYAVRSHGLASPIQTGPARGHLKHFFYPGLDAASGGLLRETQLVSERQAFEGAGRKAWLRDHHIDDDGRALVSLFCYEPVLLAQLLTEWQNDGIPRRLLVTAGRAQRAVAPLLQGFERLEFDCWQNHRDGNKGPLIVQCLPSLTQHDYDRLLWSCDLNFVRGEDSVVRALWAGKPWVWQIYPQADGAHEAKLEAFLSHLNMPPTWRQLHRQWNGLDLAPASGLLNWAELGDWEHALSQPRADLLAQPDLTTQLLQFVEKKR